MYCVSFQHTPSDSPTLAEDLRADGQSRILRLAHKELKAGFARVHRREVGTWRGVRRRGQTGRAQESARRSARSRSGRYLAPSRNTPCWQAHFAAMPLRAVLTLRMPRASSGHGRVAPAAQIDDEVVDLQRYLRNAAVGQYQPCQFRAQRIGQKKPQEGCAGRGLYSTAEVKAAISPSLVLSTAPPLRT